jgi:ATP-binding cassette, subfamily C (CFTR/MRP), member 1
MTSTDASTNGLIIS